MKEEQRHKRLRLLLKSLNKERKKQAKKTDILCHGLVGAQKEFIKALDTISFAADFYEGLLDARDLNAVLANATSLIQANCPEASVAFFLPAQHTYELHMFEPDSLISLSKHEIKAWFTEELVANICRLNKTCKLDDMYPLGLQGSPTALNKISVLTIPLTRDGRSLGFILICWRRENQLSESKLNKLTVIAPGLSKAIRANIPQLVPAE